MRAAAVIGVLAGCNSVFGLDPTHERQIDAKTTFAITLDYMVLATPVSPVEFKPIPGLTSVKAAAIGEPLLDYPVSDTGEIVLPVAFLGRHYRIVYQLPNDPLTHEIAWTGLDNAHYAVPLFGAIDRTTPPATASISLTTIDSMPASFVQPHVFTTGDQWSSSASLGMNVAQPLVSPYTSNGAPASASLGGPLARPTGNTAIWLIDYSGSQVSGFVRTSLSSMVQGVNLATPHEWTVTGTKATFALSGANTGDDLSDLGGALAGHAFGTVRTFAGGVIASPMMPGSSKLVDDATPDGGVFIPLISSMSAAGFAPVIDPFDGMLPRAVYDRLTSTRVVILPPPFSTTVTLVSGFQSTYDATATSVENNIGIAKFPVLTDSSQVTGGDLSQADLDPGANTPINGGDAVTLEFSLEKSTDLCEVVPYQVDGGLTPLRSIDLVVGDPTLRQSVTFDPDPFQVGHYYTIRITCRGGYLTSALAQGHVDAITYPFRTSTHFLAVFEAVPVQ